MKSPLVFSVQGEGRGSQFKVVRVLSHGKGRTLGYQLSRGKGAQEHSGRLSGSVTLAKAVNHRAAPTIGLPGPVLPDDIHRRQPALVFNGPGR